jgi:hypothetical protein
MNKQYSLWYCYDNTDWRIWNRYEHEHLAERARLELQLHPRPYDSTQPHTWESYLWTVVLGPGEEAPAHLVDFTSHPSFHELALDSTEENFGADILNEEE